jgi:hypothetical protein
MELNLMRELIRRQSSQSKKAEIVKYYYQWKILKPSGERKVKKNFTISIETPNETEEKATLKGAIGMAPLRGSARQK